MKPVDQTIFGFDEGNCFQACVASIFELPLNDVPNFCSLLGECDWFKSLNKWLEYRGFYCLHFELNRLDPWRPPGMFILGGLSPRAPKCVLNLDDYCHAVVAVGGVILHDPHPSREGVVTWRDATVFVPFNPHS